MRAVDIAVQRGKLIVERIADEALGRKVIALVRLHMVEHLVQTRKAFKRAGVQMNGGLDVGKARQPVRGIL